MNFKSTRTIIFVFFILTLASMACSSSILDIFDLTEAVETQTAVDALDSPSGVPTLASQGQAINLPVVDFISQQDALISLYENVSPGVVSIRVYGTNGDTWQGSGFVIDNDGHIVTNFHVATDASEFEVTFTSGLTLRAEAIGFDADSDLAVIKVDPPEQGLTPLSLGDSEQINVGQIVVAIGNPFGLNSTMTTGIVSGLGRTSDSLNPVDDSARFFVSGDLIQTDAAINPGNSGGPLLNLNGEVIGVNRSIRTFNLNADNEPVNSGIGFAVSVNILKRVVPSLISVGFYDYPYLGIASPTEFSLGMAESFGLDRTTGVLLTEVVEGGPSAEAGLILGDLIISMDGRDVRDFGEMISYLFTHTAPGDTVAIIFLRDGEEMQTDLLIGTRP